MHARKIPLAVAILLLALLPSTAGAARTLYVPNDTAGKLTADIVGPGSALTAVMGSPFASPSPKAAVLTPDGRFLFLTEETANTIERFAVAADGSLTSLGTAPASLLSGPRGAAVSPNGTTLYVAANNGLWTYAIGADGSLTGEGSRPLISGAIGVDVAVTPDGRSVFATTADVSPTDHISYVPVGADGIPTADGTSVAVAPDSLQRLAITPDGRFLYTAANAAGQGILGYAIGAGGVLTPVPGSPAPTGGDAFAVAASPIAPVLFASEDTTDTVRGYAVDADGGLTPVGQARTVGGDPLELAVSPNGRSLFAVTSGADAIARFDVAPDGALTSAGADAAVPAGIGVGPHVSPDQPPVAALTATPGTTGTPTPFNAGGSTDPDGSVARYDWDFGDGALLADGGPNATHVYAAAGTYTARVTLTDDEGCSTRLSFTGESAACNGSLAATATAPVTVTDPPAGPAAPAGPAGPAGPSVPKPKPVAKKPSCVSRHHFTAKELKLKSGERITMVLLLDGRKRARKLKAGKRSVDVKLTGLSRTTFKLKITIKKSGHKRHRSRTVTRTYKTCQRKK